MVILWQAESLFQTFIPKFASYFPVRLSTYSTLGPSTCALTGPGYIHAFLASSAHLHGGPAPSLLSPSLSGLGSRPGLPEAGRQELGGARENLYSARWCLGLQAELVIPITLCL